MPWLIKNIPNFFTLLNLTLGVLGIQLILKNGALETPVIHYYVFAAGFCDLLDGLLAKQLKAQSTFGAQLDSLADLITFGVLPTFIYASYIDLSGWGYLLMLVPICSAIRLAKFNTDDSQKTVFKGISTTAHGLFAASIPIMIYNESGFFASFFINEPMRLLTLAVFFSFLMVSPLKMISLKFQSFDFLKNWDKYVLLASAIILVSTMKYESAPFIMLIYIVLSVVNNLNLVSNKSHS